MFLLVSGRHVGAHPHGHQHGVSIQISINLGKNISPQILHTKNCCDLNLGEALCIFTFFLFPDSGIYFSIRKVLIFISIYFERRENQQLVSLRDICSSILNFDLVTFLLVSCFTFAFNSLVPNGSPSDE